MEIQLIILILANLVYLYEQFFSYLAERGLERLSDESSKKADSDSHPENWTDSDPPPQPSSPPKNSDEKKVNMPIYVSLLKSV